MEINLNQAIVLIGELYIKNRLLSDELEIRNGQLEECGKEAERLRGECAESVSRGTQEQIEIDERAVEHV